MASRKELLFTQLSEECNEVGQRASKIIRFGINEVQSGQEENNAKRLIREFNELVAVMSMLHEEGHIPFVFDLLIQQAKKKKVEYWLQYSKEQGLLQEGIPVFPQSGELYEFIEWCANQQAGGLLSDKLKQFRKEKSEPKVDTISPTY